MKSIYRNLILSAAILLLIRCQSQDERLEKAMHKSITWMWDQQSVYGGWHSQTHAVLEDGKALTPYILYHLLLIPEDKFERPISGVDRGVEFIRREIRSSMTMRHDSLINLNYPNYSAAYALRVLCHLQIDTALQRIIANHLLAEQFVEHRGITPDNVAYGGWGYGEPDLLYGEHGHVDISHTRRIVEALKDYSISNCASASPRASIKSGVENHIRESHKQTSSDTIFLQSTKLFLQGAQRSQHDPRLYEGCTSRKGLPYDGGFVSSLATLATNKCEPIFFEEAGYHYPSYATATCDGLIALHALGFEDDVAYKDAMRWLEKNQNMHTIDGLSPHDPEQWHQVMHYYHWAVRAEAMTAAGIKGTWSDQLSKMLIKEQQPEGYYINPIGGVNKEDDPLMATIFAVQAGWMIQDHYSSNPKY